MAKKAVSFSSSRVPRQSTVCWSFLLSWIFLYIFMSINGAERQYSSKDGWNTGKVSLWDLRKKLNTFPATSLISSKECFLVFRYSHSPKFFFVHTKISINMIFAGHLLQQKMLLRPSFVKMLQNVGNLHTTELVCKTWIRSWNLFESKKILLPFWSFKIYQSNSWWGTASKSVY